MKIGILGGSFDPIHNGHIALLKAARKALGLESIYLVPTHRTPLKERALSPDRHRAAMARAAIRGIPYARLSLFEIRGGKVSYTVDTLRYFRRRFGKKTELYFLCGTDLLRNLRRWKSPGEVRRLAGFAVVARPGAPARRLPANAVFLPMKPVLVSSTGVRRALERGRSGAALVPPPVWRYIRRHRLYRKTPVC